jgi:hypothetical protein
LTGNWNMGYPTPGPRTEESEAPDHVSGPQAIQTMASVDAHTQAGVTADLETLAFQAAAVTRGAVDVASQRTADAADAARRARALAVAADASAVADTAARTAVAVQLQADASAVAVADAATQAALLVAARFCSLDSGRSRYRRRAGSCQGSGSCAGPC